MADDRFEKFGRPKKEEAEKKTKKIQLSMTEKQYETILHYQKMFGKSTLTSTIEYLIEKGEERIKDEFERVWDREWVFK